MNDSLLFDFYSDMNNIEAISIAIAGPIINDEVQLTNVLWKVNKAQLIKATGVSNIYLLSQPKNGGWFENTCTKEA